MPTIKPESQKNRRQNPDAICRSKCAFPGGYDGGMGLAAPVEYAVAVDQYLDRAALSTASRRVYQISLASWAWPLVGTPVPGGRERRGAAPPVVPIALLDDPDTGSRLAAAFEARTALAGAQIG